MTNVAKLAKNNAAGSLCRCHNLERTIKLCWSTAVSSFPCLSVTLASWRSATPILPPSTTLGAILTLSRMIHLGKGFLTHLSRNSCSSMFWPPVRTLFYCSIKACVSELISARSPWISSQLFSAQVAGKAAPPLPVLWPSHAGPRDQELCDRAADMLGGPHNSFCKQMGIYQVDHRLLSGLFNLIIGFRFKQVIKTALRAFFQQSWSFWSERSGRSQNFLLKGDRMNAKNVPA